MIRAFAPSMTMQEPLPQPASILDVRQEPTARAEAQSLSTPDIAAMTSTGDTGNGSEIERLEQLLVDRTREGRELTQELERRTALLRDACSRLSELAPRGPELQLRDERDAAVARAIEAEVARAAATFKLDEVLSQLLAAGGRGSPTPRPAADRLLHARLAELDEQKQMLDARLLLVEDQLGQEQVKLAAAVRERVETAERFELELSQTRVHGAARDRQLLELKDARSALLGERDGLRARLQESERAFAQGLERWARGQHLTAELQDKLDAERSERAAQTARAEAQSLRAQEIAGVRALEQEQLRALQLELERERTVRAAVSAQLTAAVAMAESETDDARSRREGLQQTRLEAMRGCLLELRVPLVEFESTLAQVAQGKPPGTKDAVDETTLPGMVMDSDAMTVLDEQLRAKEARIEELETALRGAQQTELAARNAAQAHERANPPRDLSMLKGELIDVRASAARLSDDLAKERSRRRKMAVTVRALQAALESGEAPGPWIEELLSLINEGASHPPKA